MGSTMNVTEEYIAKKYYIVLDGNIVELPINRFELLELFAEFEFKIGVEIGVNNGRYARHMCESIPGLTYYGVDPYQTYDGYEIVTHDSTYQRSLSKAADAIGEYDAKIIKDFSALAYKMFDNNSLDFIYVDGNHDFEYVFSDILLWYPKIRTGGIISGHDYKNDFDSAVKSAVDWCVSLFHINRLFITSKERDLSWFWIKI